MSLLERVVVPPRLALIHRAGETVGYNPAINRWEYVDEEAAEVLRWLRAGRSRESLVPFMARRFSSTSIAAEERVDQILKWLILRRLLYLGQVPDLPPITAPKQPLAVIYWICTQACNLRCTYCYQSAAVAHPNELSTAEGLRLIDSVVEAGATSFVFTGGEPFTRPDLMTLAQHSRRVGLRTNVITNGHYISPENIDDVAATFNNVTVSLDHGLPVHHDCNRGVGSWAKAVAGIDLLLDAGVPVDVNSVLSHYGLQDIEQLVSFIRERPLGDHRIVPQFPMGRGRGARARRGEITEEELLALNDRLEAARRSARESDAQTRISPEGSYGQKMARRNHCGAGLSEVSVDPQGWVYPCKLLQYPEFRTDNVRDRSLADIVARHPVLKRARASVTDTLEPCRTCIIKNHCGGGCRGIHFSFTHDYIKAHPLFCAYLRRTFETQAWASTGKQPPPRRSHFEYPDEPDDPENLLGSDSFNADAGACGVGSSDEAFIPVTSVRRRVSAGPAGYP